MEQQQKRGEGRGGDHKISVPTPAANLLSRIPGAATVFTSSKSVDRTVLTPSTKPLPIQPPKPNESYHPVTSTRKVGWLSKMGGPSCRRLRKRYFVLDAEKIRYFRNELSLVDDPQGTIFVRDIRTHAKPIAQTEIDKWKELEGEKFVFNFTTQIGNEQRQWFFVAESKADMVSWVNEVNTVTAIYLGSINPF